MNIVLIIGQVLLGGFFIYNGYNHLVNRKGLAGYAQMKGIPFPMVAVVMTGIMLIIGGLSVITGMYIILGMMLLVVFLVPTTIMMHAFWKAPDATARQAELIAFNKNIALIGALLMLIALTSVFL